MGLVDGELVVNPTEKQREASDLQLTVAASAEKIVHDRGRANEVDEATMLKAIKTGDARSRRYHLHQRHRG